MSKETVYNFLKENEGKAYTTREITEKLGLSMTTCGTNLRKLMREVCAEIFFDMEMTSYRTSPVAHYYFKKWRKPK